MLWFLCFNVSNSFSSFSLIRSILLKRHTLNLSRWPFLLFLRRICLTPNQRTQLRVPLILSQPFLRRLSLIRNNPIRNLSNRNLLTRSFRSFSFLMIEHKSFWLNRFWDWVYTINRFFISFYYTRWSFKERSHHTYCSITTIASCLISVWMRWNSFLTPNFSMNHIMNSGLLSKFLLWGPGLAYQAWLLFFKSVFACFWSTNFSFVGYFSIAWIISCIFLFKCSWDYWFCIICTFCCECGDVINLLDLILFWFWWLKTFNNNSSLHVCWNLFQIILFLIF